MVSRNLSGQDSDIAPLTKMVGLASGAGRIAIGICLFATPAKALRILGFGSPESKTVTVAQIAGGRDLTMGGETLLALRAGDADRLRRSLLYNAIADAGDALAFAAAFASGGDEGKAAAKVGFPMAAVSAAGGFIAALRR